MSNTYLSSKQRDTLALFAQILTEAAPGANITGSSLAQLCCEKLAPVPPHKRRQLGLAIDLLGSRAGVALAIGNLRGFAALTTDEQRACFRAWGESRIPLIRTAYQAIRKLVLSTHYSRAESWPDVGYGGAFRSRPLRYEWEGPAAKASTSACASPPTSAHESEPRVREPRVREPRVREPRVREPVSRAPLRLIGELSPELPPAGVITALDRPLHRTADVVIIGSGAGGAVAAAELAEAGFEVVIVEGGGWHSRADFIEDESVMAGKLLAEGGLQTTDDGAFTLLQGETAGGGTTVNWMFWLRTPEFVLDEWKRDAGLDGFSAPELAPVFTELEARLHVAAVPDDAHSANNRLLLEGAAALGWSARGGALNAKGCVRCGFCTAGCRHEAKQSALVTWLPRALAAGATLFTGAHAERIELIERGAWGTSGTPPRKRVHVRMGPGSTRQTLTIDAPIIISAGGAIGTPALLQRSGLGGDAVGRFLRLHPVAFGFGVYDRDIAAGAGIPMTTLCDEQLRWNGSDYGYWIETPPLSPWLAAAALQQFGPAHAERMRAFNRLGAFISLTRDGADRLTSSGQVRVNRRGEISVTYRLTEADSQRVRASIGAMAQLHFAAGSREVFTGHVTPRVARHPREIGSLMNAPMGPNQIALGSAHLNGTCRMGVDRKSSGTTPDGERHGVRGLYISDGSLLPTAPGVNPQATIMAVATVLARRIASRHAGLTRV